MTTQLIDLRRHIEKPLDLTPLIKAHQPKVRYYFKPKVLAALFLVGGGIFGFVYGFLSI
jgi:hypothetical protein